MLDKFLLGLRNTLVLLASEVSPTDLDTWETTPLRSHSFQEALNKLDPDLPGHVTTVKHAQHFMRSGMHEINLAIALQALYARYTSAGVPAAELELELATTGYITVKHDGKLLGTVHTRDLGKQIPLN